MAREVDRMCKRYCQRPSSVVGITNTLLALDFDIAMATVHRIEEESRLAAMAEANPMMAMMLGAMK